MANIDFSEFQSKYPILDSSDITFLNNFFNRKEILDKFEAIDAERKKKLKTFFIIEVILTILAFGYFSNAIGDLDSSAIIGICVFLAFISIFVYFIVSIFFKDGGTEMKTEILPKFASEISPDLKYDLSKKHYFGDESVLITGGILDGYDRVDLIEDSIIYEPALKISVANAASVASSGVIQNQISINPKTEISLKIADDGASDIDSYENPSLDENAISPAISTIKKPNVPYTIEGYEFKSSKKHKDKNGREYYSMNNHCYLLKVKFNNARQKLTSGMALKRDINDNMFRKIGRVLAIDAAIIFTFFYVLQPKNGDNLGMQMIIAISESLKVPIGVFSVTVLIVMYVLTFQIYSKFINSGRVKTENTQFEKEFDVYCKDQIVSRSVLTPNFMYKLFDFVNKINPRRVYEFFFIGDSIYVKLDLMRGIGGSYMEVSASSNIIGNMKKFIEFYIELKNVTELAKDLGLEYFDKDTFNSQIIK